MLDERTIRQMPKLGFGLMRLPRADEEKDIIDLEQTKRMVDAFMSAGLKYFDSAYVYNGSEEAARKALTERYPRDSFFITSKLNVNASYIHNEAEAKAEFDESLRREGVDYFDFYLLHALGSGNIQKFDDWHLWEFLREKKAEGKIRHYGFSFHDTPEVLDELLTKHPEGEFVQLQINDADWENPRVQSRGCYETAVRHHKPVIVMEPVKGGTLAIPPRAARELMKAADPDASYASWAIRFAASLPGVMVVLSGMSDEKQTADNISYMKDFQPLSEKEQEVIRSVQKILAEIDQIPCTACRYCVAGCPKKINIPGIFSAMNLQMVYDNHTSAVRNYAFSTGEGHGKASDCIHCGQCARQCPQHIQIPEWMDKIAAILE